MSSDEDAASTCGGGKKKAVSEGGSPSSSSPLSVLTDDVLLQILGRLEGDPRDWARASCASPRLAALLRAVCLPPRLTRALPAELLPPPSPDGAPRAWAALHKLSVCCPGLLCAGVLLEPSDDFGLELDIGPDFSIPAPSPSPSPSPSLDEASTATSAPAAARRGVVSGSRRRARRWLGTVGAHLATGSWTLSREQGNKLLASRFRGDRLYICDWPGCVHAEERRKYMVFRGVFHDFPRSQVRCALRDTRRPTVALDCAFCGCTKAWDLYAAFCLRSFYGYHDDGEPVVRAFVCENGHVAGAWTERPLYS